MFRKKKSITVFLAIFMLYFSATGISIAGEEEKNIAAVNRFYDQVVNKGNLSVIDEVVSADYVEHQAAPGLPPNREGVKQFFAMYRAAFPDLNLKVVDLIAKGDKVWIYYAETGTHKGDFMGVAATNRKIDVKGLDVLRFVTGKAVEHWGLFDSMTMMQQLGAIPTEEAPGEK